MRFPISFVFRKTVNKLFLNNVYDYIDFLCQKTVKYGHFNDYKYTIVEVRFDLVHKMYISQEENNL